MPNARPGYEKASQLISTEPYPKQKIKEIDDILKSKDKEKELQYKNFISQGDKAYDSEDFLKANDIIRKHWVLSQMRNILRIGLKKLIIYWLSNKSLMQIKRPNRNFITRQ